ncbi:MAG: DUF3891 family protein [Phycisphaerae bacterium]
MIRKQTSTGHGLIRQTDHAALSGRLADAWDATPLGGGVLSPELRLAAALHDSGWPAHDDAPTLNDVGLPRDVFESTIQISAPVWTASAEIAAAKNPYAGLLVSLHVLHLSAFAARAGRATTFGVGGRGGRFTLLKFQQRMFEMQGQLRPAAGLSADRPVKLGLAPDATDVREQQLIADLQRLQMLDVLSLAVCRDTPPAEKLSVKLSASSPPVTFRLKRLADGQVALHPWPFAPLEVKDAVPCRNLPRRTWDDAAAMQAELRAAPEAPLAVRLRSTSPLQ